ncbi:MAG: pyridoxal-phosphate dependent enzyme [Candidatus Marinimicrobia bacterium]|jgi:threonine dehydratase|nr:pyridoxal-phosphate dependent enzyme [Candidatus Neomarinimicrobiota bacterium]MDP6611949.1 pyridoxal-phosphate dependent enzyme [Candidatus Neomarinimicrobiota bacterium]|tara:strand:- start:24836 stop:25774 length:939 start_codon:yes stop_codon:yes gene_type:complete
MVTLKDIESAHDRIRPFIHRTPVMTNQNLNILSGASLYFKCDNFQKAGSFKIRGATNIVEQLSQVELDRGVATTSSGNHGAALSMAVTRRGGKTKVVMPHNTPQMKVNNVERNGGEVVWCDPDQPSRERVLGELVNKTGATVAHPYNDERIVAGQGTAAKELIEDYPDLDVIISPVSGGGLLSGTLLAAKGMKPEIVVYGAEPSEADDAYRSLQKGEIVANETIDTICDGLRAQIGTITFPIIQKYVDSIITVTETEIIEAMKMVWERMKIIAEPSSVITLGALLKSKDRFSGKKVGLILSGGNVDLNQLPW